LGLTLPLAMPDRFVGLLVMNTTLGTGDTPLPPGFLAWRNWSAKNPDFDVARLFARGNPHLSATECQAYAAPFPAKGYRAATRAFPTMVPEFPQSDGAAISRVARDYWQSQWRGRTLMAVGMRDPVLGAPVMDHLRLSLSGCPQPVYVQEAGHFLPEYGAPIARAAVAFFGNP